MTTTLLVIGIVYLVVTIIVAVWALNDYQVARHKEASWFHSLERTIQRGLETEDDWWMRIYRNREQEERKEVLEARNEKRDAARKFLAAYLWPARALVFAGLRWRQLVRDAR